MILFLKNQGKGTVNMLRFSFKQSGLIETWLADQYVIGLMCIFCEKKKFLCLSAHVPYKQILVSIHRTAPLSVYCFTVHSNTDITLVKCIPLPSFYNNQGGVFFIQLLGQIPSFAVASELPPHLVVFRVKQGVLRTSFIPCPHGTHNHATKRQINSVG